MAPLPQVFTNAVKATALSNAQAVLGGTWVLVAQWDGFGIPVTGSTGSGDTYTTGSGVSTGSPGERWMLGGSAGRIELTLLSNGNWQALLFPGS